MTWSWEGATVWGIWKGLEEWGGDIIQVHWMYVWDSQIINKINTYLKIHFISREKWRGISFIPGSGRYVHIFKPQILYFFIFIFLWYSPKFCWPGLYLLLLCFSTMCSFCCPHLLQCTAHWLFSVSTLASWLQNWDPISSEVFHNCSIKHFPWLIRTVD